MPVHMQIQISNEVNDKLTRIANLHHRSKRSEVLAALDYYVRVHDENVARSEQNEQHSLSAPSA